MTPDIIVHGLGYVGLTAAVHFARAGLRVLGFDPDPHVVGGVKRGRPRAGDFLAYLNADVAALVDGGKLDATSDWERIITCRTHLIAVPTEREGKPFDAIVENVLKRLLIERFGPPFTIIIESTLTPGTIDRFLGLYPAARESIGLGAHVAVCPRRDWFADPRKNLETLPRVVGGYKPCCTEQARVTLAHVSHGILETDHRTAELTKALENALLHVPVIFAYQLAYALPEHDVAEALRLVGTHWRFTSLGPIYLGFGTGGRCVPLGTQYLVGASGRRLTIGMEVIDWDRHFRSVIADIVADAATSALVLGVAYRPGFKDAGLSPGLDVAKALRRRDVHVNIHDPLWSPDELQSMIDAEGPGIGIELNPFAPGRVQDYDVVLLATPHSVYDQLPLADWRGGQIVLDGQCGWAHHRELLKSRGVIYKVVGEPGWTKLDA